MNQAPEAVLVSAAIGLLALPPGGSRPAGVDTPAEPEQPNAQIKASGSPLAVRNGASVGKLAAGVLPNSFFPRKI
jgi:hypothetical protein